MKQLIFYCLLLAASLVGCAKGASQASINQPVKTDTIGGQDKDADAILESSVSFRLLSTK